MPVDEAGPQSTLALSTKVEEDFVSPLTAVRGSLEILRDFPKLAPDERQRFVETALRGCARLEKSIEQLAETVYAAGQFAQSPAPDDDTLPEQAEGYAGRIHFLEDIEVVEIDFGGFVFRNSKIVNDVYDVIEKLVGATERDWYFLVNHGGCRVWPEAWVAFAHRGKKINAVCSRGTVRYAAAEESDSHGQSGPGSDDADPDFFSSRDAALAKIAEMRSTEPGQQAR